MDENAIFKSPSEIGTQSQAKQPEIVVSNPVISPPPSPPAVAAAVPFEELPTKPSSSMPFKILKLLLGAGIVIGIIFMVINFVLPKFFGGTKGNITTLVYWGLYEDLAQLAPIISDFEKNNPNIKIDYSKQDVKQYREKLITRSNNGNGPDIFRFHNSWVPMLGEFLLPIPSNTISKEDFVKSYYPVVVGDLIKNGAIYGIPLYIDTLNLYINNELFQAAGLNPPTTWIEFVNHSRQLTVKDENNNIKTAGAAMGTSGNIDHAPDIISMLLVQNGVNLKDMSSNLTSASDALNFYSSFAIPSSNVWSNEQDSSLKMFASGSLAMYFGYSWDFFTIKSINPALSFNIYPVPTLPGRNITIASYWAEGVSSKSKHQKEALLFLKYLAQKETAQKLFAEESKIRSFGEPYARIDLADSLKDSIAYPFVVNANQAVSSFFVDGTYDNGLNSEMNTYLNVAVDSILNGTSPQSAAETLSQGVTQVLQQYGQ